LKTKVLAWTSDKHEREKASKTLEAAAAIIKAGGVVAFPTETSYGLGGDATNPKVVERLHELKQRTEEKLGFPVIVSDRFMAEDYLQLTPAAKHLMNAFMPGPLTLVVEPKRGKIAANISKGGVAFRVSGSECARMLSHYSEVPIVGTSANLTGTPPLYSFEEVRKTFEGKVEALINAGNLPTTLPSTMVDVRGLPPALVREGPVPFDEVLAQLKEFTSPALARA
jgi:L-threonylcarbamoyladenylate synthase